MALGQGLIVLGQSLLRFGLKRGRGVEVMGDTFLACFQHVADAGQGALLSVDPANGTVTTLASPFEDPRDVRWDDGTLYFTARSPNWPGGGWLYSVGDTGGSTSQLSYSPPGIDRIVLTEDSIYWTSTQSITRVAREGGTYEVLATETRVGGFVVQEDRLVWTDRDRGQVLAIPLD